MLMYEVSHMTHTPAYLSWRHQATTCILKQEGNPGSLKLQVFWDCLKSLISAIAQEKLFIKDFSHVFLALWTLGSLPDNLSPPAQWCCSGAADLDSAIDPNTQTRSCKKYVLPFFFFFLTKVIIRYFSTNLWAAPATTSMLSSHVPELWACRSRSSTHASLWCFLRHQDRQDAFGHQCHPHVLQPCHHTVVSGMRPLEELCFYTVILGLPLPPSITFPGSEYFLGKWRWVFFKFSRHSLAAVKQLDIVNTERKSYCLNC